MINKFKIGNLVYVRGEHNTLFPGIVLNWESDENGIRYYIELDRQIKLVCVDESLITLRKEN